MLLAADDDLRNADLSKFLERFPQQRVPFFASLAWHQTIRSFKKLRRNRARGNERDDLDRLRRFRVG